MAAAACSWTPTGLRGVAPVSQNKSLAPTQASFLGNSINLKTKSSFQKKTRSGKASPLHITNALNPSLVISLSTGASLFLGRFVFLSFQRDNVSKQGLPEQNGVTHYEAGDTRAKEYSSLLKSNDPAGFNIIDVLAWGSIGHIVAYFILATTSNGYAPDFF